MDAWFKAKAEELAQAAQQHVTELQQSATQLTQGALEGALQRTGVLTDGAGAAGHKELLFGQGALGFRLEGTLVVAVEEGRQAATLGLEVGDRLVAVDGYVVPAFEPGDLQEEQRAKRLIKKWMKEMPRPATLTFAPLAPVGGAAEEEEEEAAAGPEEEAAEEAQASEEATEATVPDAQTGVEALEEVTPSPADVAASPVDEPPLGPQEINDLDPRLAVPDAPVLPGTSDDGGPAASDGADGAFEVGEYDEEGCSEAECVLGSVPAGECPVEAPEATRQSDAQPSELPPGKVQDMPAELMYERGENRKLGLALQETKEVLVQTRSSLQTERRQRVAQQKKVAELQKRERVLADEVTRLSQALQTAVPTTTEVALQKAASAEAQVAELQETVSKLTQEVQDLQARTVAAESRATTAETELDRLRPQLERFSQVHDTELELLRTEHSEQDRRQRRDFEERMAALEERAARELEQAQQEKQDAQKLAEQYRVAAEDANVEAQAAAVEARAARQAEAEARQAAAEARQTAGSDPLDEGSDDEPLHKSASAPAAGSRASEEVSGLYARVEMLEARCCKLQRKLQAERAKSSAHSLDAAEAGGLRGTQEWEARMASAVGPVVARLLVILQGAMDSALRGFTQRLLKHALWLYIFYAHLLVLYAISASCYAQSGMYSAAPLDSINARMSSAAGADSRDAG